MKRREGKIDLKSLNPKREELTIEKLRELTNQPDLSDDEAKEIILNIKILVSIVLNNSSDEDQNENNSDNLKPAA